jgi:alkylhydroperoxidase/carboxymuconolactone decarboxylase family protein YurZ
MFRDGRACQCARNYEANGGAGLNNRLTLKEIEEVLFQALPYVGYPAIATALAAAAEVIKSVV